MGVPGSIFSSYCERQPLKGPINPTKNVALVEELYQPPVLLPSMGSVRINIHQDIHKPALRVPSMGSVRINIDHDNLKQALRGTHHG